jgi:hypothetical protein
MAADQWVERARIALSGGRKAHQLDVKAQI